MIQLNDKILKNMKKALFLSIILSLFFVTACTNNQQKRFSEVQSLEDSLYTVDGAFTSQEHAEKAMKKFKAFAIDFPEDSTAPVFLLKAGNIASALNQPEESILIFKTFDELFPDHEMNAFALMKIATIANDQLNDIETARQYYQKLIDTYPDSYFAKDAAILIEYLGLNEEEQLQRIKEAAGQKPDTTSLAVME